MLLEHNKTMASPLRLPENVPGAYYVTEDCIDCGLCYETAPPIFHQHEVLGSSVVYHQPDNPEEVALTEEALESCPVEAIHHDGLE